VVLDNRSLVFERRMDKFYGKHTFCDYRIERTGELWNPDLVAMAQSMGARGPRVSRRSEVRDAIVTALRAGGPVVVDVEMDADSAVYNPMSFSYPDHFSLHGFPGPDSVRTHPGV
jgi:thiamine pyrophosphate-dependent acetolactate synthase large subunit-like protein